MILFARTASIIAALAYFALSASAVHTALTAPAAKTPIYSPPAHWKYAAARDGNTFHAAGCRLMPKLPPEQMVYGNSVGEMERQAIPKHVCPHCLGSTE